MSWLCIGPSKDDPFIHVVPGRKDECGRPSYTGHDLDELCDCGPSLLRRQGIPTIVVHQGDAAPERPNA